MSFATPTRYWHGGDYDEMIYNGVWGVKKKKRSEENDETQGRIDIAKRQKRRVI